MNIRELSNLMLNNPQIKEACVISRNTIKGMKNKYWNRETEAAALLGVLRALESQQFITIHSTAEVN